MKLFTSYRLAWASLKAHKTRTMLTILGVIIGVFTITLVLLVGVGLRQSVAGQVASLDDNVILVRASSGEASGLEAFSPFRMPHVSTLTERDVKTIESTPGVAKVAPTMFLGGQLAGSENTYQNITIVATNDNFPEVLDLTITSGEFFGEQESDRNWVVLGSSLASGLIGTNQVLGQKITLKGQEYIVVGILRATNQPINLAGVDIDKAAFISLNNGKKFAGTLQLGQIIAKADDTKTIDKTTADVNAALVANHPDDSELVVKSADDAAALTTGWVDTITLAASIFAGISLLVGGIGIMNIMLVSVTERTREIGIRKAVGATKGKILVQFLLEALIMTVVGGVVGVALAYGVAYLVNLQFSLPLIFNWWVLSISLGVPLLVGVLFGLWPAWRAARQDPIVALRQYY